MRNTSKYLTASETDLGDGTPSWNIAGRPRLDVVYGDPIATLRKTATPFMTTHGGTITYTLTWGGISQTPQLTDTLPVSVSAPGRIDRDTGHADLRRRGAASHVDGRTRAGTIHYTYLSRDDRDGWSARPVQHGDLVLATGGSLQHGNGHHVCGWVPSATADRVEVAFG
jgi:hypothetical protein